MNRDEQIISEAKKHYYDDINCLNAFVHGVGWAELHPVDVWHEAGDNPTEDTLILYRTTSGECEVTELVCTCEGIWRLFVKDYEVAEWAYIKDLLPKEGKR